MFLEDILTHLKEVNYCLRSLEQTVMDLFEARKGFVAKLDI